MLVGGDKAASRDLAHGLRAGFARRFPQLPILCVSIDGPSQETSALGCVGHVMKPFRRSQLEGALEQALIPAANAL